MKKKILLITSIIISIFFNNVFAEDGPIKSCGWNWKDGCKLNGKTFYDVAASYREQEGYAYIEGFGNLHYWLYDTYSYHNGDGKDIIGKYLPYWLEKKGYTIDLNNVKKYSPNNNLANSVKELMSLHKSDVSIVLFETSTPHITVNNYDKTKNYYYTYVYYLTKTNSQNNNKISPKQNNIDEKYYFYRFTKVSDNHLYELTMEYYISTELCKNMGMPKEDAMQMAKETTEDTFNNGKQFFATQKSTDIIYDNGYNYRIWMDWFPNGSYGQISVLVSTEEDDFETIYQGDYIYNFNECYEVYKSKVKQYLK